MAALPLHRRVALFAPLLVACAPPGAPYRNELVEAAELREAWIATALPFGLAALLALALIVMRHERGENESLRWLFESHRLPDVGRWWSERRARVARDRVAREAERNRRRALPPPPALGPSTMGVGGRFVVAFATNVLVLGAMVSRHAARLGPDWWALGAVVYGAAALVASLLAGGILALVISAIPRRHPAIATACGALGATFLASMLAPPLLKIAFVPLVITGAMSGFAVGLADELSREPIGERLAERVKPGVPV